MTRVRKAKFRMGEQVPLDGVLESVRGLDVAVRSLLAFDFADARGDAARADQMRPALSYSDSFLVPALAPSRCWHSEAWPVVSVRILPAIARSGEQKSVSASRNLRRDVALAVRASPTRKARSDRNFVHSPRPASCAVAQNKKPAWVARAFAC